MTVLRGFVVTITSGVAFAITGGIAGYALGAFIPDYYRTVLRVPPEFSTDMAHVGLGLGVTQGCAAGLVVGLCIVITLAWFHSRVACPTGSPGNSPTRRPAVKEDAAGL